MNTTKASLVMVHLTVPPQDLPPADRDAVRRFLYENVRGIDEEHNQRWRRAVRRLVDGEVMQFYPIVDRSGQFHKRHMAIERKVFEAQEVWEPHELPAFREWLKTGAAFGSFQLVGGRMQFVPSSAKYEECSDDEFKAFHERAMAFLRSDRALRKLWPHLKPAQRREMLEVALAKTDEEET